MRDSRIVKVTVAAAVVTAAVIALAGCSATAPDVKNDASGGGSMTLANNPLRGKTLTGTFQPDWGLPLASMDGDKPVGFVIEIAEAAAKELGAKITVVANDFSTTIPGVQSGKYDIGNGTDATLARQQVVDVVSTYKTGYNFVTYKGGHKAIGPKMSDLCGLKISQIAGNSVLAALTQQSSECVADGKPAIDILSFPDKASSFLAVQSGRADATSLYGASAGYLTKTDPKWSVSGPTVISGQSGFAVKKGTGNAELWTKAVDASIADGSYGKILKKYGIEFIAIDKSVVNPAK